MGAGMPDLSRESTLDFWMTFMGGSVSPIIEFIEHSEEWINIEDEAALSQLGQHLDTLSSESSLSELDYVRVCAKLYLSQKLRIMQILDSVSPGFATKMIDSAQNNASDDPLAKAFLQRNLIFERMRIMRRIFASDRVQLIQRLYEK